MVGCGVTIGILCGIAVGIWVYERRRQKRPIKVSTTRELEEQDRRIQLEEWLKEQERRIQLWFGEQERRIREEQEHRIHEEQERRIQEEQVRRIQEEQERRIQEEQKRRVQIESEGQRRYKINPNPGRKERRRANEHRRKGEYDEMAEANRRAAQLLFDAYNDPRRGLQDGWFDLHELRVTEACEYVDMIVDESRGRGRAENLVFIVGLGNHSGTRGGVLGPGVQKHLTIESHLGQPNPGCLTVYL